MVSGKQWIKCEDCANSFMNHVEDDKIYCLKRRICKWGDVKRKCIYFAKFELEQEAADGQAKR